MNLKNVVLCVGLLVGTFAANAQINILNATTPDEIGVKTSEQIAYDNDNPLPYGYTDERDVLWSKTTWEIIDLDERVNFPLYYPIDTNNIGSERRSLYDVLVKNIKEGKIENVYADSYFTEKRTLSDLDASLVYRDTTDAGIDQVNNGEAVDDQYIREFTLDAGDIEEWRIRGYWYLDKRQGELKYRLLGICPVAGEARSKAFEDEGSVDNRVELFWVWYPGAREVLHKAKAFNRKNTSQPISYDHLLNSRRFHGVIYKEDNVQGDRTVNEYINDNALMQLLESDRIQEVIRNIEIDLWNY
ncbi:type IX secretion system ring protein PorN/GldN [Ulvibacter litoralis]|uniref:Gliding motility associated protien GldN n=1 Tax=Ulvibacter litoralis TaxID=227084 RepID=A0A1G7CE76_9FLAO|nr:gliding motility protein GldN [Ulvibacter litoralis]GHC47943.1 gliding motility protein GldO [Ulvibacter litoralis]SDE36715.1 gliding motility associated protien GldN [Ulvibacter litoralis]